MSKGGALTERNNHRPISVLPNVSKLHEFFANLDLMQYAHETDVIGEHANARNSSTTVVVIKAGC